MLDPTLATDAIVAAIAAIPSYSAAMTFQTPGGPLVRIAAFHYLEGSDEPLVKAVEEMPSPSTLVVWEGTRPGNFDGSTIWKHRWGVYIRMGNAAGVANPMGYERLWWTLCNALPTGSPVNIRYIQLYPGLDIMDTPSAEHMVDSNGVDFFKASIVIPEIGDN